MSIFRTLTGTFAILALLLGLLPSLSQFWFFSFVGGMRLHIAVAAFILSFVFLALNRTALSATPLIATFVFFAWICSLHASIVQQKVMIETAGRQLKFIEFNVLAQNKKGREIADWLIRQDADVVYTLESEPLLPYIQELAEIYPYRIGCGKLMDRCDLMMLSKHPLENAEIRTIGGLHQQRFIRAGLTFKAQYVTLVAMHLTKPYFDSFQQEELFRAYQLLRKVKGPIILGGDFNSSLLSTDILSFIAQIGLKSFITEPRTWPISAPEFGLAIDHILVRPPIQIDMLKRIPDNMGSNHYGLIAEISLPTNANE